MRLVFQFCISSILRFIRGGCKWLCASVKRAVDFICTNAPLLCLDVTKSAQCDNEKKKEKKMFAGFSLINRKVEKKFSMVVVVVDRRQREKR